MTTTEVERQSKTLKFGDWYEGLPANRQIPIRDRIIAECGISINMFYAYKRDEGDADKLVMERIAIIAGRPVEEMFPKYAKLYLPKAKSKRK